jgi:hypothetical protein
VQGTNCGPCKIQMSPSQAANGAQAWGPARGLSLSWPLAYPVRPLFVINCSPSVFPAAGLHVCMFACCMSACLHVSVSTCPHACMSTWVHIYMLAYLHVFKFAYPHLCMSASLNLCLFVIENDCVFAYVPICLAVRLHVCLTEGLNKLTACWMSARLPVCFYCMSAWLLICMIGCLYFCLSALLFDSVSARQFDCVCMSAHLCI